jgi:penicillin-binding protein 1B
VDFRSALRASKEKVSQASRMVWGRVSPALRAGSDRLRRIPHPVLFFVGATGALFFVAAIVVVLYFSRVVSRTMDGRRWSLPTRLYSDVWAVRPGDTLSADDVVRRLTRLRYVEVPKPPVAAGQYAHVRGRLAVTLNARETAWGRTPGIPAEMDFSGRRVAALKRADDGTPLPYVVFEPEVVGSVYDEKMQDRTLVTLDQVPPVVLDAILTTEDRDFFTHGGISFRRLVGAVLQGAARGGGVRGTSTLTQQLVKNMFLTPERKLKRKVVEALMAVILEAKYSKKEILEAYLNEIYLGQRGSISVTGVEEAARFYFGKSVSRLDLPEAAMLAGLISSPGKYSPFRNPENARQRRGVVLKGMLEQKKIDKAGYEAALLAPLTRSKGPPSGIIAPHFVDFVLSQVKEAPGFVKEDGLSVYTTLDPDMQQAAQAAVLKGLEELEKRYKRLRPRGEEDVLQAAVIALDPATGSVRALVGGRDYQVSQFNRIVQAHRQPGSLFKPFVYLTAFGKRDLPKPITPASIFVDSPIALVWGKGEDETWSPKNYDREFRGPMTARQALEQSINIPTVRIAVTETAPGRTLLPDIVDTARRAGIASPMRPYPSLALGAFETSPMEIAAAYCTFANGGFRVRPNALLGIVGPNARRIETKDEPVVRGADADAISILDSVLQGVVDRGTGASARRLGAQGILAGKTGTTNDGRDAWFIGFSPRLLVAVWVGFDDNRGLNLSGSSAALPIFADFVRRLPSQYFEAPFPTTPGIVTASIDPTTGMLVTEECPKSLNEVFLEGTAPTERCTVHGGGGPGPGIASGNP